MNTNVCPKQSFLVLLLLWLGASILMPQQVLAQAITEQSVQRTRVITVGGVVKDQKTHNTLENVNVYVPGTNIGTVTNKDGVFSLKLTDDGKPLNIEFSYLGYKSNLVEVSRSSGTKNEFYLQASSYRLDEIVVTPIRPRELVEEAIDLVRKNYSQVSTISTLFYRETVQKRRRYINISEAISQSYKSPYSGYGVGRDKVKILKGRRLVSPDAKDTLSVKLEGGPNLATYADAVKNPDVILSPDYLDCYDYSFNDFTDIDNRLQLAIDFKPKKYVELSFPLYYGTIYIDRETKGISRIEFHMNMENEGKVIQLMLRKRPAGMRFKPQEVSYTVNYRHQNGKFFLNYVNATYRFRCDWKRRLLATNYVVSSEMVVTNRLDNPIDGISYRESFRSSEVLSDKVMDFYDKEFWEDYNIIQPTESLENAVDKLKKAIDRQNR